MSCPSNNSMTLEEAYKDDPGLLAFYKKKLLIKGWAGSMNQMERDYVRRKAPGWFRASSEQGRKHANRAIGRKVA